MAFFREHLISYSWSATFCHHTLSPDSSILLIESSSTDNPEDSIRFSLSGPLQTDRNSLMFTGPGLQVLNITPSICWRDKTAGHKQSERFLKCIDDNVLLPVIQESMR